MIILLHGGGGSRLNWHEVGYVDGAKESFRVIAMDIRGHGESDKPVDQGSYSTDKLGRDILAVADHCGAETFVLWGFFLLFFKPERARIPGLHQRAAELYSKLGPVSRQEFQAAGIVVAAVTTMSLRSFIPALAGVDKSGIILLATVLFFLLKIRGVLNEIFDKPGFFIDNGQGIVDLMCHTSGKHADGRKFVMVL